MDSVSTEEWKAIPGKTGYEASNHGRIRSLDRIVTRPNRWGVLTDFHWKGRVLKEIVHRGYAVAKLGADPKRYGVHQLVALAFIGECPLGFVIDHKNANKRDNRPGNLEYVTNSENVRRAHTMGLMHAAGEGNGFVKLTDEQVFQIRQMRDSHSLTELAGLFGVTKTHVSRIINQQSRTATL